jgi:hypothetical protein
MKNSRRTFHALLALSTILGVLAGVVDLVFPAQLPAQIRETQRHLLAAHAADPPLGTGLVMFFVLVAGATDLVGLYRFRAWARPLNLALCGSVFLYGPMMGYQVISGWALALFQTCLLTWGALTALSYTTPLSAEFRASPSR